MNFYSGFISFTMSWQFKICNRSNFTPWEILSRLNYLMKSDEFSNPQHLRVISCSAGVKSLNDSRNITEDTGVHQSFLWKEKCFSLSFHQRNILCIIESENECKSFRDRKKFFWKIFYEIFPSKNILSLAFNFASKNACIDSIRI